MNKVLVISRKYPPQVGGMETYTVSLLKHLSGIYEVESVLLGKSQMNLVWFLPYALYRTAVSCAKKRCGAVYLCDALLAPLGVMIKKILGVKVFVTVHGLDMTYDRFFYQDVVPHCVAALDGVVCVSRNTLEESVKRGVPRSICRVITNGIEPGERLIPEGAVLPAFFEGKKVILTVGRLVKRKGVSWFIENVMPRLGEDFIYAVVGEGPEQDAIKASAHKAGQGDRVFLMGRISDDLLEKMYASAHALVMPNQRIKNDPEGFGIVAIQASGFGVPVVANKVDGICDAVIDGKTGWLIGYNDVSAFADKVLSPGLSRDGIRSAGRVFEWPGLIKEYKKVIDGE
jgi:glycosyltransferase involved in cell wall biosynthesis